MNAGSTRLLLEACLAAGAGHQRFVLAGSLAAIGPSRAGKREEDPFAPVEWYGESKAEAERLALSYAESPARGYRSSTTHHGPGRPGEPVLLPYREAGGGAPHPRRGSAPLVDRRGRLRGGVCPPGRAPGGGWTGLLPCFEGEHQRRGSAMGGGARARHHTPSHPGAAFAPLRSRRSRRPRHPRHPPQAAPQPQAGPASPRPRVDLRAGQGRAAPRLYAPEPRSARPLPDLRASTSIAVGYKINGTPTPTGRQLRLHRRTRRDRTVSPHASPDASRVLRRGRHPRPDEHRPRVRVLRVEPGEHLRHRAPHSAHGRGRALLLGARQGQPQDVQRGLLRIVQGHLGGPPGGPGGGALRGSPAARHPSGYAAPPRSGAAGGLPHRTRHGRARLHCPAPCPAPRSG